LKEEEKVAPASFKIQKFDKLERELEFKMNLKMEMTPEETAALEELHL
jgi:hypothetical protein